MSFTSHKYSFLLIAAAIFFFVFVLKQVLMLVFQKNIYFVGRSNIDINHVFIKKTLHSDGVVLLERPSPDYQHYRVATFRKVKKMEIVIFLSVKQWILDLMQEHDLFSAALHSPNCSC